jgi:pimeloyl-ACP methyl ester carboxylesterase
VKVLFVHGALVHDGQWWWHRMVEPLAQRGLTTEAVVLPSCEATFGERKDMYADVAAVTEAVAAADKPIVLCGHSYGGAVITEAGRTSRTCST